MSFLVFRANVPAGVNVGRVEGFYVTHLADRDADGIPDEDHLDGTATFTPRVNEMRWPTLAPPRTSVKSDIVCPIIQGFIYPPGTTQDDVENNPGLQRGVVLIATDQPLAEPDSVQYDVKIDLVGSRVNPVTKTIDIPAGGTLDLAVVQGAATVPGTVTVVSSEDRIRAEAAADGAEAMRDEIQLWLDSANGTHPTFDPATNEYTTESVQRFLAAYRDGLVYGVAIPKSTATACTKTGANTGIANPVPGVIGTPAVDPYVKRGPFLTIECNAWIDPDGWPHVTAIQGDPTFSRDGSNGDVWIMAPTLYWRMTETEDDVNLEVSDSWQPGFLSQPKAFLPDGRRRPFMLYAKYGLSMTDETPRSISGGLVRTLDVSHNSLITICKNASTGYSGKSFADDWYVKAMFLLKYATKNSQSVFAGHTSYSVQLKPAVGETGVKRVLVTKAEGAQILVGSTWSLGNGASTDLGNVATRDIFESARVVSKQDIGDQTSVVFDAPNPFNTATTQLLSVMPWRTGACDEVPGDGSPYNPLSGAEPFTIQGIEIGLGAFETLGDVILSSEGEGWSVMLLADSKQAATSVTANYTNAGPIEATDRTYKYPLHPVSLGGLLIGAGGYTGSSTAGMADGYYIDPDSTVGTRQWRSLGSLGNGAVVGLWVGNGSSALGNAHWSFASRLSGIGRAGG